MIVERVEIMKLKGSDTMNEKASEIQKKAITILCNTINISYEDLFKRSYPLVPPVPMDDLPYNTATRIIHCGNTSIPEIVGAASDFEEEEHDQEDMFKQRMEEDK